MGEYLVKYHWTECGCIYHHYLYVTWIKIDSMVFEGMEKLLVFPLLKFDKNKKYKNIKNINIKNKNIKNKNII